MSRRKRRPSAPTLTVVRSATPAPMAPPVVAPAVVDTDPPEPLPAPAEAPAIQAVRLRTIEHDELHHLPSIWPVVGPMVLKGCARSGGEMTPDWIVRCLHGAQMQLHLAITPKGDVKGLFVTEINHHSAGWRTINVVIASGSGLAASIPGMWGDFLSWSAANGASSVRFIGRRGWLRAAAALGFAEIAVMAEASVPRLSGHHGDVPLN